MSTLSLSANICDIYLRCVAEMAADKLEINRKRHICSMCEIDELGAKEEEEHFGECKNADVSDPTTNAYNAYIIQKIQIKFQTADLFVSSRLNMVK